MQKINISVLAKNRLVLEHNGKTVRLEIDNDGKWNLYLPPKSVVYPNEGIVLGMRKVAIKI